MKSKQIQGDSKSKVEEYFTEAGKSGKEAAKKTLGFAKRHPYLSSGLLAATIAGTFSGEGGFSPFYNRKSGLAGGINVGFYTHVEPDAEFDGINFSVFTKNHGRINGINANVWSTHNYGEINGVSVNGVYSHNEGVVRGGRLSVITNTSKGQSGVTNGLEASLVYNNSNAGNLVQLGAINKIKIGDRLKKTMGANYKFGGKARKTPGK